MAHSRDGRMSINAVNHLQARLNGFVAELRQVKDYMASLNKEPVIGLDRLLDANEKALAPALFGKRFYQIARNNLECDSRLWNIVKRCRGLVALKQNYRADWDFVLNQLAKTNGETNTGVSRTEHVTVDAVVDGGATWIRLLTVSEQRLLSELADSGAWDFDSDSVAGSDNEHSDSHHGHDCDSIKTIRGARAVVMAAKNQRFKYRHPRVHILLPKLEEGKIEQIDRVIERIRQLGDDDVTVVVDCGNSAFFRHGHSSPPLFRVLPTLVVDELRDITPTVNIDISWLIALTSDLSHERSSKPFASSSLSLSVGDAKTPASIREACGRSLCQTLYPTLAFRKLVCTRSAAERVWSIAKTLASPTELARLRLLVPLTEEDITAARNRGPKATRVRLAGLSVHGVPDDVFWPVDISDDGFTQNTDVLVESGRLPRVAPAVANKLQEPNRSIFLFGWATGYTTLTANSAMVNRIKRTLEVNRTGARERGPDVFVRWVTRSFDAKEKPNVRNRARALVVVG
ncbi:hypothetical protein MCOR27_002827 [Pyricularia oryzae]|nr:hypothetical protein MCOR01_007804 [Pyricularia oryzae]KAI6284271.1 hypothetical protein MCOR27_002827 [Pyricularia oryzae]KAI6313571.1 hypothetical protein MCOR30_010257 [Pyricularia oryzae]KAI6332385.1 hypothetical protein MCOR28_010954 [Pyricularia oryzae]KAI6379222.1 hypothetical protein MCOR32_004529 [Pyricularia oryzae]